MNSQILQRGKELSEEISTLQKILEYWENATWFSITQKGKGFSRDLNVSYDPEFHEYKQKKIEALKIRLEKVEHEFKIL